MQLDKLEIAHQFNAARRAITDMELELSPGMDCPIDLDAVARYAIKVKTAIDNVLTVAADANRPG